MKAANFLAMTLLELTPYVSFGFGSVLSSIRDDDLMPHDDDLDIIIALQATTFSEAKHQLQTFLSLRGFIYHGDNLSHFGVNRGNNGTAVDVFIGFPKEERISWFPSSREGFLFSEIFPVQNRNFLGQNVLFPAKPERYLEVTYGPDWREPIPNWNHPWNALEYDEYL